MFTSQVWLAGMCVYLREYGAGEREPNLLITGKDVKLGIQKFFLLVKKSKVIICLTLIYMIHIYIYLLFD